MKAGKPLVRPKMSRASSSPSSALSNAALTCWAVCCRVRACTASLDELPDASRSLTWHDDCVAGSDGSCHCPTLIMTEMRYGVNVCAQMRWLQQQCRLLGKGQRSEAHACSWMVCVVGRLLTSCRQACALSTRAWRASCGSWQDQNALSCGVLDAPHPSVRETCKHLMGYMQGMQRYTAACFF